MSDRYLLGIDLGTTTCRAAIFDLDGRESAAAYVETTVRYPRPLWAEVDPEVWWADTVRVVREALATSGIRAGQIVGIGLSGLMHAPVLLDAFGQPVAPAMLWMDQRCAPQCEAMRREAEALGLAAGRAISTTATAPKLRWLVENCPEVVRRARLLMLPKDFVRYRLTGIAGSDPSDASGTGLFDRDAGNWLRDVVGLARVPADLLPELRPSWSLAGGLTETAASETGLRHGTPVAMGGADTLCTRLGAGNLDDGEVCAYLGTAAWLHVLGGRGADGRQFFRGFGATSTTGAALRWVRDLLGSGPVQGVVASYDELTRAASDVPPGAEGLFFFPHLMGERGPQPDPLARGSLIGLTLRHGRSHVVRAVLEGTAFQIRRIIEARLTGPNGAGPRLAGGAACGGAARSALWMQVLSDVTRLSLRVPAVVEAGVLGAAILGGAAARLFTVEEGQDRMVRAGTTFAPESSSAARYDALYHQYCQLDDLLGPWFRENKIEE